MGANVLTTDCGMLAAGFEVLTTGYLMLTAGFWMLDAKSGDEKANQELF